MRHFVACLALAASLALAGCFCKPEPLPDLSKLPPPISLDEQLSRLDARVRAIPRLKAKTVERGVEIRYRDNDNHEQILNAEGTLLLRQPPGNPPPGAPAELNLVGRAFDIEQFQAGRNNNLWWFILRANVKTAWIGDSRRPIDWEALTQHNENGGVGGGILRADLVQDLLGLRTLGGKPLSPNRENEVNLLRIDDFTARNIILVESIPPSAAPPSDSLWIKRELYIDRFTGDIREVRLYGPSGEMVMRSLLSDYKPATYTAGRDGANNDAQSNKPPNVPYTAQLDFPAQKLQIVLHFDTVAIPATLPDAAFEDPDFKDQDLRVIREP